MRLPATRVFGGRLKDREQLYASSSGGAFTALSDVFLKAGDAVVCSSYDFDTHRQVFRRIETVGERDAARGSKYFQADPGDIFTDAKQWLSAHPDRQILFVGVGCQAAGFLSYAELSGFRDRVTVVDIICHGVPSPKLWREYAAEIEGGGKMQALTFKDKRNGWLKPTAVATVNGEEVSLRPYIRVFGSGNALRPSCHVCPYATTERATDITIGDFWHIEEKAPQHFDKMGTSLFIVHTERGLALFDSIRDSLDWFESNTGECWQLNLERPTPIGRERRRFWADYREKGVGYVMRRYGSDRLSAKIKKKAKNLLKAARPGR